jgi:hypothetical protein
MVGKKLTEPADNTTNNVAARKGDVEVEGLNFAETSLLKELDRIAQDGVTTENLSCPHDAVLRYLSASLYVEYTNKTTYNLGSSVVGTSEALKETGTLGLGYLESRGVFNQSNLSLDLGLDNRRVTILAQSGKGVASEISLSASNSVPW